MEPGIAIIGGSQAYTLLREKRLGEEKETLVLNTPFGPSAPLHRFQQGELGFWFLSRHGERGYERSAPFVNYRANIWALKELGTQRIVAWSGPGIINLKYRIGSFVLPHDVIDETRGRPSTFYEGKGLGFIRQGQVFCPWMRERIAEVLRFLGLHYYPEGVYVCTQGPRLETAAEIRKYRLFGGDLVGMTLVPEVFLAKELEMCYAAICYLTNYAEGVVERGYQQGILFEGMQTQEEREAVEAAIGTFPRIIRGVVEDLRDRQGECSCQKAMLRYRQQGIIGEDWHHWIT